MRRSGVTQAFTAALDDPRDPDLTEHSFQEMVRSRVLGIQALVELADRSSPASPESWPGDGSRTSGVPEKSRTCGQIPGKLIGCVPGGRTDLAAQQVRRPRTFPILHASHEGREKGLCRTCESFGVPMSDVTQILSTIEQGDPRAAEQLLPLVYDELRQLAAQKPAQDAPGQTLGVGRAPAVSNHWPRRPRHQPA